LFLVYQGSFLVSKAAPTKKTQYSFGLEVLLGGTNVFSNEKNIMRSSFLSKHPKKKKHG